MAGEVYSTRFALGQGGNLDYVVPGGRRAVLKCITAWNGATTPKGVAVYINNFPVWQVMVQGTSGAIASGIMVVANEGELLRISPDSTVICQASGFLLRAS